MTNLSVIITYFNKGEFIFNTIESVLHQKYPCEIIVIDDCSDHLDSIEAIKCAKNQYLNIDFCTTPYNYGSAGAKNFGIEKAWGDIIVLLDGDDELPANSLLHISKFFAKHLDTDLLFGNYILKNGNFGKEEMVDCSKIAKNGSLDPEIVAKNWLLLGSSPFAKKAWRDACGFDPLFPKTDDIDFHIRMILGNKKIRYINEVIYQWNRRDEGNFMTKTTLDSAYSVCKNMKFYYLYLGKPAFLLKSIKNLLILLVKKISTQR